MTVNRLQMPAGIKQAKRTSREDKPEGQARRKREEDETGRQARRTNREDKSGGQVGGMYGNLAFSS